MPPDAESFADVESPPDQETPRSVPSMAYAGFRALDASPSSATDLVESSPPPSRHSSSSDSPSRPSEGVRPQPPPSDEALSTPRGIAVLARRIRAAITMIGRHHQVASSRSMLLAEGGSTLPVLAANTGRQNRILVVDDVPMNRRMARRLLESRGSTCEEAVDGADAVERLRLSVSSSQGFDIVLMDYQMPNLDGPGAARRMRSEVGYGGLIIGLTGNAEEREVENYKAHGANHVLVKPFDLDAFDQIVGDFV
jgi:CheY-like chemotaxis protein